MRPGHGYSRESSYSGRGYDEEDEDGDSKGSDDSYDASTTRTMDESGVTNSVVSNDSADDSLRYKRAAAGFATLLQHDCWRRAREYEFEQDLHKRLNKKEEELDDQYMEKHQKLVNELAAKHAELVAIEKRLNVASAHCEKVKSDLERERKILKKTRKHLMTEYNNKVRQCEEQVTRARNECTTREAAIVARATILKSEAERWEARCMEAEKRLREKDDELIQQRKAAASSPESALRGQVVELECALSKMRKELDGYRERLEEKDSQLKRATELLQKAYEQNIRYKHEVEVANRIKQETEQMEADRRRFKEGERELREVNQGIHEVKNMLPDLRGIVCEPKEHLLKERHELIETGLYNEDDDLIRALDKGLANYYG